MSESAINKKLSHGRWLLEQAVDNLLKAESSPKGQKYPFIESARFNVRQALPYLNFDILRNEIENG